MNMPTFLKTNLAQVSGLESVSSDCPFTSLCIKFTSYDKKILKSLKSKLKFLQTMNTLSPLSFLKQS